MKWDKVIYLLLVIHVVGFSLFYFNLQSTPSDHFAFITFTNSDKYAKGVIALAVSLKDVESHHPLIVLLTSEVSPSSRRILTKLGCILMEIQPIQLPPELSLEVSRWGPAFSKLHAFKLDQYKKLVWLDSDLLVVRDIDSMFDLPYLLSGCIDTDASSCQYKESRMNLLNSGVMSLIPTAQQYSKLIATMNNKTLLSRGTINDQDVIMAANPDWHHLPYPQYGAQITHCICENDPRMWDSPNLRILHFTAGTMALPKPWDYNSAKDNEPTHFPACVRSIYDLWWNKYKRGLQMAE